VTAERRLGRRPGLLAVAVVAVGPLTVAATHRQFGDELPGRLPVWWALDQTVAATADTTVVAMVGLLLGAVATGGALAVVLAGGRLGFHAQRLLVVGLAAGSGLVSGLWWTDLGLVLGAGPFVDPRAISAPGWDLWWPVIWLVMLALAAGLACGSPPKVTTDAPPAPRMPRVTLPDDEPVEWQVDLAAVGFGVLAALLCVIGAGSYRGNPAVATFCWVAALVALAFARTRVRIDESGVRLSPWGLPAPAFATYDTIVDARAEPVRPLRRRGRGYRILPGATGWIPRTRIGLVLAMADGRRFAIAMDQAEVAAGIVNSMLDRRRLPPAEIARSPRQSDAPAPTTRGDGEAAAARGDGKDPL
jgi:hypothetical protein